MNVADLAGSNLQPPDHQLDAHPTEPLRPAVRHSGDSNVTVNMHIRLATRVCMCVSVCVCVCVCVCMCVCVHS